MWAVSVDLGKQNDFTVKSVVGIKPVRLDPNPTDMAEGEMRQPVKIIHTLDVAYMDRSRQKGYPEVVDDTRRLMQQPELLDETHLLIDMGGVGEAVYDMMREAQLNPIGIRITGGNAVSRTPEGYNVSKEILVSALIAAFQTRRISFRRGLSVDPRTIQQELQAFQVKLSKKENNLFEAQAGEHDDIVMSLAMAAWYVKTVYKPRWLEGRVRDIITKRQQRERDWSPLWEEDEEF
jgi:hypothetical protein